uniref:D-lactate dehydrogenase [cytochrome], mitochondrial n=1 Tax=Tanacetum cinerariifolium TaxID=118510 RepID=A0A699JRC4_TANCI|nr:D-lactate dehydrogenase [cytochrome], mitochondrial [Tanacetum cinerariifolium]
MPVCQWLQIAMCSFPRVTDAYDVAIVTMMSGIQVLRLDKVQVKAVNLANGKDMPETPTLMLDFIGTDDDQQKEAKRLNNFMVHVALLMEGTCTGLNLIGI